MSQEPQPDLVDLSHRRSVFGALVTASVPENTIEAVDLSFRRGRLAPWDTRLEIVRAPELLGADLEGVKAYAKQHFVGDPDAHIIPCFYLFIDEQTATDGSVMFVQQDWLAGPDETMRIMPQHAVTLFTGFLWFDEDFERCREEDLNENQIYDPSHFEFDNRPGLESLVRFPKSLARLVDENESVQKYVLDAPQAQALGLNPVERTIDLRRETDGTFGDTLSLTVKPSDIHASSDQAEVWGPSDYYVED